jgi:hypothetical protein
MTSNGSCEIDGCNREAITPVRQVDPSKMPMWLCRRDAKIMRVVHHALRLAGEPT